MLKKKKKVLVKLSSLEMGNLAHSLKKKSKKENWTATLELLKF